MRMRWWMAAAIALAPTGASAQSFVYSTQWFVGLRENVTERQERVRARAEAAERQRAAADSEPSRAAAAAAAPGQAAPEPAARTETPSD